MKVIYSNRDGAKVPEGHCVQADNVEDTFVVVVRSLSGVGADAVRDLIQQKYEVEGIDHTLRHVTVQ